MLIHQVTPDTWGVQQFAGGEELVAVNGLDVAAMSREEFRERLQQRPLTIRFRRSNKVGVDIIQ